MFKYVGIAVLAGIALIASLGSNPQSFRIRFAAGGCSEPFRCGTTWQSRDVASVSFEYAGSCTGVEFTLGFPEALDQAGATLVIA